MFHFRNIAPAWLLAVAAAAAIALAIVWLEFGASSSSSPEQAGDYEDCVARLPAQGALPAGQFEALLTECDARFAARRKPGGGYAYYDFMQDKRFDIAGPNPTDNERKAIDRDYIDYLDAQRREAMSAVLARRQNERLRADLEVARQPAGPPLVLAPVRTPLPMPRRVAEQRGRSRPCTDDPLRCTLSKLTNAVKDAFASSKPK